MTDIEGSTRLLADLGTRLRPPARSTTTRSCAASSRGTPAWRCRPRVTPSSALRAPPSTPWRRRSRCSAVSPLTPWPGGRDVRVRMGIHTGEGAFGRRRLRRHGCAPGRPGGGRRARRTGAADRGHRTPCWRGTGPPAPAHWSWDRPAQGPPRARDAVPAARRRAAHPVPTVAQPGGAGLRPARGARAYLRPRRRRRAGHRAAGRAPARDPDRTGRGGQDPAGGAPRGAAARRASRTASPSSPSRRSGTRSSFPTRSPVPSRLPAASYAGAEGMTRLAEPPARAAAAAGSRQRRAARGRRRGASASCCGRHPDHGCSPPPAGRCASARSSGTRSNRSATSRRSRSSPSGPARSAPTSPWVRATGSPSHGSWTAWGGCPWPWSSPPRGSGTLRPAEIADRLDSQLGLLRSGPRDLPRRQQTLRSTLLWSYDLLDEPARRTFAVFAVFPGGATLDALEDVLPPAPDDDPLEPSPPSSTRAWSVAVPTAQARFTTLQVVRELAARTARVRRRRPRRCGGGRPSGWRGWPGVPAPHAGDGRTGRLARPPAGRARQHAGGAGLGHRARPGPRRRHRGAAVAVLADAGLSPGGPGGARGAPGAAGPGRPGGPLRDRAAMGGVAYWQRDLPAGEAACTEAVRLAEQMGDRRRARRGAVQPRLPPVAAGPAGRGRSTSPTGASSCSPSSRTPTAPPDAVAARDPRRDDRRPGHGRATARPSPSTATGSSPAGLPPRLVAAHARPDAAARRDARRGTASGSRRACGCSRRPATSPRSCCTWPTSPRIAALEGDTERELRLAGALRHLKRLTGIDLVDHPVNAVPGLEETEARLGADADSGCWPRARR